MTAAPAFLLAGADLDLAKWSLGSQILIVLGTSALSMGLRTMAHPALRKIGALGVLATSFFIGWLFTGFWQAGVVCASSWLSSITHLKQRCLLCVDRIKSGIPVLVDA